MFITSESPATQKDPRKFPFPPALPIIGLLLSWGLGRIWPIAISWPAWSRWLGLALFTLPFGLAIWGVRTFRRQGTVAEPTGDTTQVVTSGPFKYTRNPMYLTLTVVYLGSMLLFRLPWALVLLVPLFLALHFGIVLPEEKYLESKFGEDYVTYKRRVRRWL
jgi:protein-S-isoprenylcysteine O-methyltransferase Ste14